MQQSTYNTLFFYFIKESKLHLELSLRQVYPTIPSLSQEIRIVHLIQMTWKLWEKF